MANTATVVKQWLACRPEILGVSGRASLFLLRCVWCFVSVGGGGGGGGGGRRGLEPEDL